MPVARQRPSSREILLFIEAMAMLALAALAVRFLPFRVLTRTLSWGGPDHSISPNPAGSLPVYTTQAVRRASRRSPWRTVCIHRGLAVQWMLRRRGLDARFHYGLSQADSVLSAHVWVSLDGTILIGEEEASRYKCVAEFPPAPPKQSLDGQGSST